MTKSRNKSSKTQSSDQKLNIINAKAAGIDLGAREHWVCVPQELCCGEYQEFWLYHSRFAIVSRLVRRVWYHQCGDGIHWS